MTAYDHYGAESDYSNEVEATILTPPTLLNVSFGLQPDEVSISWEGLASNDPGSIAEYRVYYDVDSGEPYDGIGAPSIP